MKHKTSNTSGTGSHISFIYFDLGGVLTKWKPAVKQIAKSIDKPESELRRVFWKYANEAEKGKLTAQELWQRWQHDLNIIHNNSWDFMTNKFVKITQTHRLIGELSADYKIGILSNITHGMFENLSTKGHVPHERHFHTIIKSCEVGFIKPEAEIYQLAETRAGVPAEQILFIDDAAENIAMAMTCGWHGIQFDEENPDQSVSEIRQLLLSKTG